MYTTVALPSPASAPPGLRCPACHRCEFESGLDSQGRVRLTCTCGTFTRLLRRTGDPAPLCEPCPPDASQYAQDTPPAGSWWIAFIRARDGKWRPIALAQTPGRCWDAALSCPLDGDILLAPTDPPTRPGPVQAAAGGDDGR
jgi:hypothetical protein